MRRHIAATLSTLFVLSASATTPPTTSPRSDTDPFARLFQNDPDSFTLVDVAAVFALAQGPNATPEQILAIVNTLTNSNLTQLNPEPNVATAD